MDKYIAVIIIGQVISSVAIIYTNKTEIEWIKKTLDKLDARMNKVEDKTA
ncbi:MAG: hypothetical protein JJV99_02250 [Colwellia sp.]|nr:hypothetical protein [Colwellia sp.]